MVDSTIVKTSEMDAFNDAEAFLSWEEGPYWSRVQKNVIEKLDSELNKVDRVLEVGCGKSVYLPLVNESKSLAVGVDLSKALLVLNKQGERVLGDGENLAFVPKSFDYVFAVGSIHHMPDKAQAIREIAKVCKKQLFIIEPHSFSANWFYWAVRKIILCLFGYEKVKKWAGFVAPYETFISKSDVKRNLVDFDLKIKFYSPFRAPPLKAFSRINFEAINDFLERVPGIRRLGTYIVIEATRMQE